jgi:hypothetical protein
LVRRYHVTDAAVHDSQTVDHLLMRVRVNLTAPVPLCQSDRYRLFVNIQTDVGDMLIHGTSPMPEALRQDIRRSPRTCIQ